MIFHMHKVMQQYPTYGGTSWLQYDWQSWGEMNAEGVEAWQRQDPWLLFCCLPGASAKEDCFVINTDTPLPIQPTKHKGQPGLGNTYPTPSKGQPLNQEGGGGG